MIIYDVRGRLRSVEVGSVGGIRPGSDDGVGAQTMVLGVVGGVLVDVRHGVGLGQLGEGNLDPKMENWPTG